MLAEALRDAEPGDARSVLALLVDEARRAACPAEPASANPGTCPNCGESSASARSPYCGPGCREEAAFVRQFRTSLAQGTLGDSERQARLGQSLWHLLGGGYPHRLPLIPASASKQALKRAEGRCERCGAPASSFDHVGSG